MNKIYEKLTITIPKEILDKFRRFCEDNAINMSGRITKLIEKNLKPKTEKYVLRRRI